MCRDRWSGGENANASWSTGRRGCRARTAVFQRAPRVIGWYVSHRRYAVFAVASRRSGITDKEDCEVGRGSKHRSGPRPGMTPVTAKRCNLESLASPSTASPSSVMQARGAYARNRNEECCPNDAVCRQQPTCSGPEAHGIGQYEEGGSILAVA